MLWRGRSNIPLSCEFTRTDVTVSDSYLPAETMSRLKERGARWVQVQRHYVPQQKCLSSKMESLPAPERQTRRQVRPK